MLYGREIRVYPDFGQPKVRKWWAENQKFLTDIGVAGVWNDMNEPASFTENCHQMSCLLMKIRNLPTQPCTMYTDI